jgi:acetylornithine deacetylase/succinyl-diaminopimelate desuccinylase-like protein
MGRFISRLENLKENATSPSADEAKSTVAPTVCVAVPNISNVTPGECSLVLDWRNTAGESEAQILDKVSSMLSETGHVEVQTYKLKTYTGIHLDIKRVKAPFSLDRTHPLVQAVAKSVSSTLGREVELSGWTGATDGGCFMEAGIPFLGFGPGESEYEHTAKERVSLQKVKEAMECYPAIIANVSKLGKRVR